MNNQKKSCWNCEHSKPHRNYGTPGTYYDPPDYPSIDDCEKVSSKYYDELMEIAENIGYDEYLEDAIAELCLYYTPEKVKCYICKKETYVSECVAGIGSQPDICSKACAKKFDKMMTEEYLEYSFSGLKLFCEKFKNGIYDFKLLKNIIKD